MFAVGIADVFNPILHGGDNRDYLKGHFLCMMTFTPQEIAEGQHIEYALDMRRSHLVVQEHEYNTEYQNKMFRPRLLKVIVLPTGEHICIDKTTYLRQLQRRIRRHQNT